jgi:hypothetical protein
VSVPTASFKQALVIGTRCHPQMCVRVCIENVKNAVDPAAISSHLPLWILRIDCSTGAKQKFDDAHVAVAMTSHV